MVSIVEKIARSQEARKLKVLEKVAEEKKGFLPIRHERHDLTNGVTHVIYTFLTTAEGNWQIIIEGNRNPLQYLSSQDAEGVQGFLDKNSFPREIERKNGQKTHDSTIRLFEVVWPIIAMDLEGDQQSEDFSPACYTEVAVPKISTDESEAEGIIDFVGITPHGALNGIEVGGSGAIDIKPEEVLLQEGVEQIVTGGDKKVEKSSQYGRGMHKVLGVPVNIFLANYQVSEDGKINTRVFVRRISSFGLTSRQTVEERIN